MRVVRGNSRSGARSAAFRPEHADRVRFVDIEKRVEALRDVPEVDEIRDVAVHREERLGDDDAAAHA